MTKPHIVLTSTKDVNWKPMENIEASLESMDRKDGTKQWFIIIKAPDDAEFITAGEASEAWAPPSGG